MDVASRLLSNAGGATAEAVTMTVAAGEGAYLRSGDVVRVSRTGEAIRIVLMFGDTVALMVRGIGGADAAAINGGDQLVIVGNTATTGSRTSRIVLAPQRPRWRQPAPTPCRRPIRRGTTRQSRRSGRVVRSRARARAGPDEPEPEPPDLVPGRARDFPSLQETRVVARVALRRAYPCASFGARCDGARRCTTSSPAGGIAKKTRVETLDADGVAP